MAAISSHDVETFREAAERTLLAEGPRADWAVRLLGLADLFESEVDLGRRNRYADEIRRVWEGRNRA